MSNATDMNVKPLAAGDSVRIVKGCRARSVAKGRAVVASVTPLGADCGHSVRVVLSYAGRTLVFFARHPNRIADTIVRLNDGNPLHVVEISR